MGGYLDKPVVEKETHCSNGNGIQFALSSMQGYRQEQEDAHVCIPQISKSGIFSKWSFYMVLDGHGGKVPAQIASQKILTKILEQNYFNNLKETDQLDTDRVKNSILQAFKEIDAELRDLFNDHGERYEGGSTAVGLLMSPDWYIFMNLGDSRAVLVSSDKADKGGGGRIENDMQALILGENSPKKSSSKLRFATVDQKPENIEETIRIRNAGGEVFAFQGMGPKRIDGQLAVARAFGDFQYKDANISNPNYWKVSNQPVVTCMKREKGCGIVKAGGVFGKSGESPHDNGNKSYDRFCVIACDGIYDVLSNEDLMEYINFGLKTKRDVQVVANELLDTCLSLGSKDNMSAIILRFDYGSDAVGNCDNGDAESLNSNFNTEFDPKAAEKDEILLEKLKSCVFDELRSRGIHTPEVGTVLKNLPEHTFDLPGVGISGRYSTVEKMCVEYYSNKGGS